MGCDQVLEIGINTLQKALDQSLANVSVFYTEINFLLVFSFQICFCLTQQSSMYASSVRGTLSVKRE